MKSWDKRGGALHLDVGDIASLEPFVGQVRQILSEKWGLNRLDILVNNAAVRSNPELNAYIASQTSPSRVDQAKDIDNAYWINGQRIEASGGMFL